MANEKDTIKLVIPKALKIRFKALCVRAERGYEKQRRKSTNRKLVSRARASRGENGMITELRQPGDLMVYEEDNPDR